MADILAQVGGQAGSFFNGFSNFGQIFNILSVILLIGIIILVFWLLYLYFIVNNYTLIVETKTGDGTTTKKGRCRNNYKNTKLGIVELRSMPLFGMPNVRRLAIPLESIRQNTIILEKYGVNPEDYRPIMRNAVYMENQFLSRLDETISKMGFKTLKEFIDSNTTNTPIIVPTNPLTVYESLPQDQKAWALLMIQEAADEYLHKRDLTPILMVAGMGILLVALVFTSIWMTKNIEAFAKISAGMQGQAIDAMKQSNDMIRAILQLKTGGGGTPPVG
jgi:hypothetical protein